MFLYHGGYAVVVGKRLEIIQRVCGWCNLVTAVELLLKDTLNKGHNTFNLSKKDKFCHPYRTIAIQFHLLKRTTSV